mmetsp:Transcript_9693/g.58678  ORF Transcript_9693/g.58678 Transcript_9693/m.58678 type:complete len:235 (-) Transcript_9693:2773-3477(-)
MAKVPTGRKASTAAREVATCTERLSICAEGCQHNCQGQPPPVRKQICAAEETRQEAKNKGRGGTISQDLRRRSLYGTLSHGVVFSSSRMASRMSCRHLRYMRGPACSFISFHDGAGNGPWHGPAAVGGLHGIYDGASDLQLSCASVGFLLAASPRNSVQVPVDTGDNLSGPPWVCGRWRWQISGRRGGRTWCSMDVTMGVVSNLPRFGREACRFDLPAPWVPQEEVAFLASILM